MPTIKASSPVGNHLFSKDITDRKRTEESLRESELQKSAILDTSFDRIRYVDKHLRIVFSDRTAVSELGMSAPPRAKMIGGPPITAATGIFWPLF